MLLLYLLVPAHINLSRYLLYYLSVTPHKIGNIILSSQNSDLSLRLCKCQGKVQLRLDSFQTIFFLSWDLLLPVIFSPMICLKDGVSCGDNQHFIRYISS